MVVKRESRLTLALAITAVGLIVLVGSFGIGYTGTGRITLTYVEARALFGVILTYLPIALIAVFLQGRVSEVARLLEVQALDADIRASDVEADALEAEQASHEEALAKILQDADEMRALAEAAPQLSADDFLQMQQVLESAAELQKRQEDTAVELREISASRKDHRARMAPILKQAHSAARSYLYDVLFAFVGVIAALFGCLMPTRFGLLLALLVSVGLTTQLVFALIDPVTKTLGRREELLWTGLTGLGLVCALGLATGVWAHLVIV